MKGFVALHPDQVWPHFDLVVDYVELGQDDVARSEIAKVLRLDSTCSLQKAAEAEFPAQRQRAAELAKAGLK